MQGINTSMELQSLIRNAGAAERVDFCLHTSALPTYEGECFEGDRQEAWIADGRPQLMLNVGHTEHNGYTIVFFENITHGSGMHAMAVFAGKPEDVGTETAPLSCFRCHGQGRPCEIHLPEDEEFASLVMVPTIAVEGGIVPKWYVLKN